MEQGYQSAHEKTSAQRYILAQEIRGCDRFPVPRTYGVYNAVDK